MTHLFIDNKIQSSKINYMKKIKVNATTFIGSTSTTAGDTQVLIPIKSWFENPITIITALGTIVGIFKILSGAYPQYTWLATGVSILLFIISSIQAIVPSSAIHA